MGYAKYFCCPCCCPCFLLCRCCRGCPRLCRSLQRLLTVGVAAFAVLVGLAWREYPILCDPEPLTVKPDDTDFCTPSLDYARDVREKGWGVVRDILDEETLKSLVDIRRSMGPMNETMTKGQGFYDSTQIWQHSFSKVARSRILSAVDNIKSATGIDPDMDLVAMEWLTNHHRNPSGLSTLKLHQDHLSLGVFNEIEHYLNIMLFVDKPEPKDAGVRVVPFDALKARCPEFHDIVKGSAMRIFEKLPDGRMHFDSSHAPAPMRFLDFDLMEDNLTCAPELVTGDALVLRGDAIHGTDWPQTSWRTAVALRVSKKRTVGGMMPWNAGYLRMLLVRKWFDALNEGLMLGAMGERWWRFQQLPESEQWLMWATRWSHGVRAWLQVQYWNWMYWTRSVTGLLVGEEPYCTRLWDVLASDLS